MKQLIFCLVIVMSISLAFSGGKPCCKKKAGKNAVSCKFNHVAVESEKDISGTVTIENSIFVIMLRQMITHVLMTTI